MQIQKESQYEEVHTSEVTHLVTLVFFKCDAAAFDISGKQSHLFVLIITEMTEHSPFCCFDCPFLVEVQAAGSHSSPIMRSL